MRAQNLTISVPPGDPLCDKNCPYCVSRMTGYVKTDVRLMSKNISKLKTLAEHAQGTSVLFTGKGEPLLNETDLFWLMREFRDYPMELQTNGLKLSRNDWLIKALFEEGLNVLAVSLDDLKQFISFYDMFAKAKEERLVTRVTLNVTNKIPEETKFEHLVDLCRESHVDQLMLRRVTIPEGVDESHPTAKWIEKNTRWAQFEKLWSEMDALCSNFGRFIRRLHFGPKVYDYNGVSVSYSDYCVQESTTGEDIRSLIFLEDGHCYTSWNSKASILF